MESPFFSLHFEQIWKPKSGGKEISVPLKDGLHLKLLLYKMEVGVVWKITEKPSETL